MFFDNSGNTLNTARKINLTATTQAFTDFVGATDFNDFYSFSLNSRSSLNLSLTGLITNADVQIIQDINSNGIVDSSNEVITSGNSLGIVSESVRTTLNAGNYFIRVFPGVASAASGTNYNLNASVNAVPIELKFNTSNFNLRPTDVLTINGGQIFDVNGVSDISLIDFQLFQNGQLANSLNNDVTRITANPNDNRWGSFTHSLSLHGLNLSGGNYTLRATARDTANNLSQSFEQNFTLQGDWFSLNLRDQEIINITRSLASDSNLSRNDVIAIFRDAKDSGVVDTNELLDLRAIIANSSRFRVEDHVRVLSDKVANSDVANTTSGIGNLFAGSSANQLERLLGKWFLGSDRPQLNSSEFTYREARGALFQNGISYQDVVQGILGNCYFLGSLAVTALRTPSVIQNMFIDNGDNTLTVRFYKNGVADYVTVDRFLPTLTNINSNYRSGGNLPYARIGGRHDNPNNELWVALAEKAYAQINESGWTLGASSNQRINSYQAINSGFGGGALRDITGRNTSYKDLQALEKNTLTKFNDIIAAFNQGQMIYLSSKTSTEVATNIVGSHGYILVDYNSATQRFRLYNPWGTNGGYLNNQFKDGFLNLSINELINNFRGWFTTV